MPNTVKENYLKALFYLSEQGGQVNITELSKRLGVSKPTASNMVKSLEYHDWVVYQKYKPVQLTEKGRKAAAMVIRKHRLAEMFLQKIMGFGWEEVHEIAEQLEHIASEKLFDRMDQMLQHPLNDPHGSPIPDAQGNIAKQELKPLAGLAIGQKGQLTALAKNAAELLHYLNQFQIKIGTLIELIRVEPFDESCLIRCDGGNPTVVSKKVAESLLLKVS